MNGVYRDDEALVRAALQHAFAAPVTPEVVDRGEAAIRAAAAQLPSLADAVPEPSLAPVVPLRSWAFRARRGAAAAAAALTFASTGGVAAAAQGALPGELLYPVKQSVEQVWTVAAPGEALTARVHLRLAARRLDEAARLPVDHPQRAVVLVAFDRHLAVAERLGGEPVAAALAALRSRAAGLSSATPPPPAPVTGAIPTPSPAASTDSDEERSDSPSPPSPSIPSQAVRDTSNAEPGEARKRERPAPVPQPAPAPRASGSAPGEHEVDETDEGLDEEDQDRDEDAAVEDDNGLAPVRREPPRLVVPAPGPAAPSGPRQDDEQHEVEAPEDDDEHGRRDD